MLFFSSASIAFANNQVIGTNNHVKDSIANANNDVTLAFQAAQDNDFVLAKSRFQLFKTNWRTIEDSIKKYSRNAYKDIESSMGQVSYAFLQSNQISLIEALNDLIHVNQNFINGKYTGASKSTGQDDLQNNNTFTLSSFITLLDQAKVSASRLDKEATLFNINQVRDSWLSVEGVVVTQSATIYDHSERDMVIINAMIKNDDFSGASNLIEEMISYLQPLAEKTAYTFWDAAIILLREGLEALLVIGALLAFTNKSHEKKASHWVGYGVLLGVIASISLAFIVKLVFSSSAFGTNNFLISGWSGIFAAVMLLYMSYWLHSKSNLAEWNNYIASISSGALENGRLISLAFLSFLAIFREGTEIVLFIIGIINQISLSDLLLGLFLGSSFLAVLAFLMLYVGVKLPVRPFFMASSVIMLYLCIKFTGMGLHSLQLAGALSSTPFSGLPSISLIGFYPNLQSATPQLLIVLSALIIVSWKHFQTQKNTNPLISK